jgi:hypothetical protein
MELYAELPAEVMLCCRVLLLDASRAQEGNGTTQALQNSVLVLQLVCNNFRLNRVFPSRSCAVLWFDIDVYNWRKSEECTSASSQHDACSNEGTEPQTQTLAKRYSIVPAPRYACRACHRGTQCFTAVQHPFHSTSN